MTTTIAPAQPRQPDAPRVWTIDAVRNLGATIDVETAGAILGIGRSKSYELAKASEFPVRVLRIGRRYLVPTPSILTLLGIDG
jgi:hypothetical protein